MIFLLVIFNRWVARRSTHFSVFVFAYPIFVFLFVYFSPSTSDFETIKFTFFFFYFFLQLIFFFYPALCTSQPRLPLTVSEAQIDKAKSIRERRARLSRSRWENVNEKCKKKWSDAKPVNVSEWEKRIGHWKRVSPVPQHLLFSSHKADDTIDWLSIFIVSTSTTHRKGSSINLQHNANVYIKNKRKPKMILTCEVFIYTKNESRKATERWWRHAQDISYDVRKFQSEIKPRLRWGDLNSRQIASFARTLATFRIDRTKTWRVSIACTLQSVDDLRCISGKFYRFSENSEKSTSFAGGILSSHDPRRQNKWVEIRWMGRWR